MRSALVTAAMFTTLAAGSGPLQDPSVDGSRPLVLNLSRDVDTTSLWIEYYMTGAFGGYGDFVRPRSDVWSYPIPTIHEDRPAETLKVIVYARGHQFQVLDLSSMVDSSERSIDVELLPLATVPFLGRVEPPLSMSAQGTTVRVTYFPSWLCEFFKLGDCMVGPLNIASVALEADGRFALELPDLARDPTVGSFTDHGNFVFQIVDRKTKNIRLWLKPETDEGPRPWLAVADLYPGELVFLPEIPR